MKEIYTKPFCINFYIVQPKAKPHFFRAETVRLKSLQNHPEMFPLQLKAAA
jgi:hypothetical protein